MKVDANECTRHDVCTVCIYRTSLRRSEYDSSSNRAKLKFVITAHPQIVLNINYLITCTVQYHKILLSTLCTSTIVDFDFVLLNKEYHK